MIKLYQMFTKSLGAALSLEHEIILELAGFHLQIDYLFPLSIGIRTIPKRPQSPGR
jgi:hypothetical protein